MIETVFFDMNNVIENYNDSEVDLEKETLNLLVQEFKEIDPKMLESIARRTKKSLRDMFGKYPFEHHYIFWDRLYADISGNLASSEELNNLYTHYLNIYRDKMKLYEDSTDCIRHLLELEMKLGIIANGNTLRIRTFLDKQLLTKVFQYIVTSGDFYFKKPERLIFDYARLKANNKPLNCLMIGDRLDNDISGANGAGMWTIHLSRPEIILRPSSDPHSIPDDVVTDLSQVKDSWLLKNQMDIKCAVILAAGKGSRMGGLTSATQKCLLPVAGQPILSLILERMFKAGIEKVFLLTNYLEEQVREYIRSQPYWKKCKLVKTKENCTGKSLLKVLDLLDDDFVFCHGDILFSRFELHALIKKYLKGKKQKACDGILSIVGSSADLTHAILKENLDGESVSIAHAFHYGRDKRCELNLDIDHHVYSFGLGILNRDVLLKNRNSLGDNFMVEALLSKAGASGKVLSHRIVDKWAHLETIEDYDSIQDEPWVLDNNE